MKKYIILIILILIIFLCFLFNVKKDKTIKKVTKTKEIIDKIKPEIKILGREEYIIVKNGVYEEKGAVAVDNLDGDITNKITIKNNIDFSKPGNYKISYEVKDKKNNKSKIYRKIKVIDFDEKNTDGISVLMYHYFYDDEKGETGPDSNYISKTNFISQLKYLKENNYYFPNMKEISLYLDNKLDLPKNSVVITMDDGHADNYTIAYPLSIKYKVPMTMFVVTSWTDVTMDLQKEVINSGYMSMQSHTHNMHRGGCPVNHGGIIQCINYEEGINDLKKSKELLNAESIAYPFGDINDHAKDIVKNSGFSLGFTTNYGKITPNMDKFSLPRIRINGNITLEEFKKSL